MGLFGFLKADINDGVREFRSDAGAVLIDVRTPGEFAEGHVPGAVNVPLGMISEAEDVIPAVDTHVYVYCQSGGRSSMAASQLKKMGYTNVKNIGGIASYAGEREQTSR